MGFGCLSYFTNLSGPTDARNGIPAGLTLQRGSSTLPHGDVARFRIRSHRRWHQNLHRVHQIAVVVIADLAAVVAGVLRAHIFDLQRVPFEQLEARVPRDDQTGRGHDGTPPAPQQDVVAWRVGMKQRKQ